MKNLPAAFIFILICLESTGIRPVAVTDAGIPSVINIEILNATGKAVIRFRAASNNEQLHIPVSYPRTGIYIINKRCQ